MKHALAAARLALVAAVLCAIGADAQAQTQPCIRYSLTNACLAQEVETFLNPDASPQAVTALTPFPVVLEMINPLTGLPAPISSSNLFPTTSGSGSGTSTVQLGAGTAVVGHVIDDTLAGITASAPLSVKPTVQLALVPSSAVIGHVIDDTLAAITAAAPLPVKPAVVQLPTTILSGTIATGGTFQVLQAAATRSSLEFQNKSSDTCSLYFGANSNATTALSLAVPAGGFYSRYSGTIPSDNVSVSCPTTADAFYASAQ